MGLPPMRSFHSPARQDPGRFPGHAGEAPLFMQKRRAIGLGVRPQGGLLSACAESRQGGFRRLRAAGTTLRWGDFSCARNVTPRLFATPGFPPTRAGLRAALRPCARPRSGPSGLLTTAQTLLIKVTKSAPEGGRTPLGYPPCSVTLRPSLSGVRDPRLRRFPRRPPGWCMAYASAVAPHRGAWNGISPGVRCAVRGTGPQV